MAKKAWVTITTGERLITVEITELESLNNIAGAVVGEQMDLVRSGDQSQKNMSKILDLNHFSNAFFKITQPVEQTEENS
jgi:hypothetical protein